MVVCWVNGAMALVESVDGMRMDEQDFGES